MLCDLYVNSEVNFDTVFHAQLVVSSSHRASCLRLVSAMAAAGNDPLRWDAKLAGGADPDAMWRLAQNWTKQLQQARAKELETQRKLDLNDILEFFHVRPGNGGEAMSDKLREPEHISSRAGISWYRLPYNHNYASPSRGDWQTGYHGTTFTAIYSVLFHGRFIRSKKDWGRVLTKQGRPREGVYLHGTKLREKAMGYCGWQRVREHFFAPMLEVIADRHQSIATGNDQWCQPPSSIQIQALWIGACKGCHLPFNQHVAMTWDARDETNPIHTPRHFTNFKPPQLPRNKSQPQAPGPGPGQTSRQGKRLGRADLPLLRKKSFFHQDNHSSPCLFALIEHVI